jgi:hypothetical protein
MHHIGLVNTGQWHQPRTADTSEDRAVPTPAAIQKGQHSFTVEVSGIDIEGGDYEDSLYEAGCGDALVMVIDGRLVLDFSRRASSFGLAVESAIKDISKAGGTVIDIKKIES